MNQKTCQNEKHLKFSHFKPHGLTITKYFSALNAFKVNSRKVWQNFRIIFCLGHGLHKTES